VPGFQPMCTQSQSASEGRDQCPSITRRPETDGMALLGQPDHDGALVAVSPGIRIHGFTFDTTNVAGDEITNALRAMGWLLGWGRDDSGN